MGKDYLMHINKQIYQLITESLAVEVEVEWGPTLSRTQGVGPGSMITLVWMEWLYAQRVDCRS